MITYIIPTAKNPTLQAIITALESAFSGLKVDTFPPNPFPSSSQIVNVHGSVGLSSSPDGTNIIIMFFEASDEWEGTSITQGNITVTFAKSMYSSIPTQAQVEAVLQGAGLI